MKKDIAQQDKGEVNVVQQKEGEVNIAKEIEEGEKEIVLSTLSSTHALSEIIKLKEKVESQENPNEFVKELVRGLDDESSQADIKKTTKKIFVVCEIFVVKNLLWIDETTKIY